MRACTGPVLCGIARGAQRSFRYAYGRAAAAAVCCADPVRQYWRIAGHGLGDYVFIPNVREALKGDLQNIKAYVLGDTAKEFSLYMAPLTADERKILADGCLINFYKH